MSDLFIIIGLGNPGSRYSETRHNAGFWFLERVLQRWPGTLKSQPRLQAETARVVISGRECLLARPTTFMNHSGQAVRAVVDYYRAEVANLLVAYDELDLPPGTTRLKQGGGHGGHNGMRDIFRHLPDQGFLRLRIGIGHPGDRDAVTPYVLGRPSADDERLVLESIAGALDVLPMVVAGDLPGAMKELHTVRQDGL